MSTKPSALQATIRLQRPLGFSLAADFNVPETGYTAIYGASGSGKTTLLRCLAGLETGGHQSEIRFNGQVWQDQKNHMPCHQRGIGLVFQEPRLFPHLSVRGNLNYALKRRHNSHGPTWDQVCQWLDLNTLLDKPSNQLSGGQMQRVAIGRALLSAPQLLLMDEPLASLDQASKQQILSYLERLHQHLDIPVLYVSHDLSEVTRLADQLIVLKDGRIEAQGPTLELCSQLQLELTHEEQAAAILVGTVEQQDSQYQLSHITIEGESLSLSQVDAEPGQSLRIQIPARDVSIARSKAEDSSILNIIPCQVDEIEHNAGGKVLVRLRLGEQFFLSRLTRKSIDRLQLAKGDKVYAQIKSVALLNDQYQGNHD